MFPSLNPGSYIFTHRDPVLGMVSKKLQFPYERLHTHPDFYLIKEELSIGIDTLRGVGHYLRMKPIVSRHKIVVIENFHLATIEAQNAFLKTFEEPPEYAYIFLVTPYIDRLLKTIVSRAQVITDATHNLRPTTYDKNIFQAILKMTVGERFMWLESEVKGLEDKVEIKLKFIEMLDAFLQEGIAIAKTGKVSLESIEYAKEAKWKIEQGFPSPKLLMEGFLVKLSDNF